MREGWNLVGGSLFFLHSLGILYLKGGLVWVFIVGIPFSRYFVKQRCLYVQEPTSGCQYKCEPYHKHVEGGTSIWLR